MRLFWSKTNIDFMGKRRIWYVVSAVVILVGMVSLVIKGIRRSASTFSAARSWSSSSSSPCRSATCARDGQGRLRPGGDQDLRQRPRHSHPHRRTCEWKEASPWATSSARAEHGVSRPTRITVLKEDKIGPKIGAELRRDAVYAIIASLIAIWIYVGFRFKFVYGVGAVVALFHDVLVDARPASRSSTACFNLEIDQNMIAAFLTLVGPLGQRHGRHLRPYPREPEDLQSHAAEGRS